jgi:putative RecB family exonuclease
MTNAATPTAAAPIADPDASLAGESAGTAVGSAPDGEPAREAGRDAATAAVVVAGALSPSRAGDFMTCPLLYRFRVLDRLPEPPSPAAARGTLVHAVLERLFDQPASGRTAAAAHALLEPEWQRMVDAEPELSELLGGGADGVATDDSTDGGDTGKDAWFAQARQMLDRYFALEDPRRLEPAQRELYVESLLDSGLLLRGYIDRLDIAPNGDIRVVDYKTGTAPREEFEARALFQMKFYALVLWRLRGRVPRLLQLMYLGNGEILRYAPDEADLRATQRKTEAIWRAIERATQRRDWRPRPSRICDWCAHKARCPAFGGTPPPLPAGSDEPGTSITAAAEAHRAAHAEPLPEVPSARSFAADI